MAQVTIAASARCAGRVQAHPCREACRADSRTVGHWTVDLGHGESGHGQRGAGCAGVQGGRSACWGLYPLQVGPVQGPPGCALGGADAGARAHCPMQSGSRPWWARCTALQVGPVGGQGAGSGGGRPGVDGGRCTPWGSCCVRAEWIRPWWARCMALQVGPVRGEGAGSGGGCAGVDGGCGTSWGSCCVGAGWTSPRWTRGRVGLARGPW